MKRHVAIFFCLVAVFMFCGCGEEVLVFNEPAMQFFRDGAVNQTIVEDFDKEYYSLQELKGDIGSSINEYNKSAGDSSIELSDAHIENGKVYATFAFSSFKDDRAFQGVDVFYGTVRDASNCGYLMDAVFASAADGSTADRNGILGMSDNHVIIVDTPGIVVVPYNILYISSNVEFVDEKTVRISSDLDGLAYIVTK